MALDGEWTFEAAGHNALVLEHWLATVAEPGRADDAYAGLDVDESAWDRAVAGAWAYQLGDPERAWPVDVWYRFAFHADDVPPELHLVVDGFAGEDRRIWLNGRPITAEAVRSPFDSQMRSIELSDAVRSGRNILAVRLTLTAPTGGITDRLKLIGRFAVARGDDGAFGIVRPEPRVKPASWTEQGYPFYSGVGIYRTTWSLPAGAEGRPVEIETFAGDDVVEVVVNGVSCGASLWPPHAADVTRTLRPGDNDIEIRVANTLANLLNAEDRPSGLSEAPRAVIYREEEP
jgi:hypothetical protein